MLEVSVSYFSKSVACLSAMLVDVPPLEYRILFNVCKAVVLSNHAPDDGNLYIRLENVRIANSLTGNTLIKSLARATCCRKFELPSDPELSRSSTILDGMLLAAHAEPSAPTQMSMLKIRLVWPKQMPHVGEPPFEHGCLCDFLHFLCASASQVEVESMVGLGSYSWTSISACMTRPGPGVHPV